VTHYQLLGVAPTATMAEIRAAYLRLARRHHPDAGGDSARMRDLNEAWSVLGDARRRRAYDRTVAVGRRPSGSPPPRHAFDEGFEEFGPAGLDDLDDLDDVAGDRPIHDAPALPVWLTVAPVLVFAVSVVSGILGMMLTSGGLLGLAIVLFGASAALMILLPLLQMTRGSRRARRSSTPR
jgi:curved DNA-binding protein CbpA